MKKALVDGAHEADRSPGLCQVRGLPELTLAGLIFGIDADAWVASRGR